jgi:hypothetical protein
MTTHQLQNEKEIIINWINELEDSALISKIKNLMNSSDKCLLSDEQKEAINKGLASLKDKGGIPHEEAMLQIRNKFPKYFNRK